MEIRHILCIAFLALLLLSRTDAGIVESNAPVRVRRQSGTGGVIIAGGENARFPSVGAISSGNRFRPAPPIRRGPRPSQRRCLRYNRYRQCLYWSRY